MKHKYALVFCITILITFRNYYSRSRYSRSRFTFSIVPEDDYYRIYRRQAIDPYRQLLRFRRLGVQTPSAPPGGATIPGSGATGDPSRAGARNLGSDAHGPRSGPFRRR